MNHLSAVIPKIQQVFQKHEVNKYVIIMGLGASLLFSRLLFLKINGIIHKSPPQLYGMPFIGSLGTMLIWRTNFIHKLLPQYGDVVKFNIGPMLMYKINDATLATRIHEKAIDRHAASTDWIRSCGIEPWLLNINQEAQWEQRRKTLMRNFNIVLNHGEVDHRITQILKTTVFNDLDSKLKLSENKSVIWHLKKDIRNAVFNVLYLALFGEILLIKDPKYVEYYAAIQDVFDYAMSAFLLSYMPNFVGKALFGKGAALFQNGVKFMADSTAQDLDKVESKMNVTTKDNDNNDENNYTLAANVFSEYIKQSVKNGSKDGNNGKVMDELTRNRLISDITSVVAAGMDTTGHTTEYAILLLAKYPQMQETVYKELRSVFGNKEEFELSKVNQCPHLRAFINEALRLSVASAGGMPHSCDKDLRCVKYKTKNNNNNNNNNSGSDIMCDFVDSSKWEKENIITILNDTNGIEYDYIIEKHSIIEVNYFYLLRLNSKVWNLNDDPASPNLNYWLIKDNNGKIQFKNNKNSIPFSTGKRDCLGKALAMKELYAFLGNLILKYEILAANDDGAKNMVIPLRASATCVVEPAVPVRVQHRMHD